MTEIRVLNVTDGESLCFPLALLQGEVVGLRKFQSSESKYPRVEKSSETAAASDIEGATAREGPRVHVVTANSSLLVENGGISPLKWPVLAGYFKILVPLHPGENKITISHIEGCVSKIVTLFYQPQSKKRYVRLVYVKCGDSEGEFDAPDGEDNSAESAVKRLQFNSRLLQTFTAESINHHGLGRYTFRLEEDESGVPVVHIFTSKLKTKEAHQMNGDQLYDHFGEELRDSDLFDPDCKWVVFMSCTHYDPPGEDEFQDNKISQYARAHTALGGGSLAVFGTGGLHTWAPDLESLVKRFTDTQVIDRQKLFDDSCGRCTYWANYSTGLGATMHEVGHALDLAHTSSGIMSRGFDDMNCAFTISPFHRIDSTLSVDLHGTDSGIEIADIKPKKTTPWPADYPALTCRGAHWYRSSAVLLRYHRWINDGDHSDEETPTVHWSLKFRGPVGNLGDSCQKDQTSFNDLSWLLENNARMGGVVVFADKYVYSIQTVAFKVEEDAQESQILSDPRGTAECGERHEFIFESADERITRIDVRAGAWIDAVRFHSNKKSSAWFGGQGGDYHKFIAPGDRWFTGLFGTHGKLLGSLGVHLNTPEERNDIEDCGSNVLVESSAGLRLIELHDHTGEVCRHWEFLEPSPPRKFPLPRSEIFSVDQTRTLLVEDDKGAIFRTGVVKELHSLVDCQT